MKLLERIVKEYTQPINEARAKKWTDKDKYWSKNITGKIAAKGSGKYDITEIWGRGPYPTKKYQDGKADDDGQGGKTRDNFGDQNMKQHAFWKKRYDIEITGQHFDALAKNGKGAVVPLLYNRGGISRDTVLSKGALDKDYESYFSKISYVDLNKSKHKVFISGENQDIYDWFVSPEWTKNNKTPSKMLKDILGVESWRDTMLKDNPKALKSLEIDKSENGDFWDDKEQEYIYRSGMNRQQLKVLDTRMKRQGFVWDKEAGRYPLRSNGGYVDRKGKRLDFDNFKVQ